MTALEFVAQLDRLKWEHFEGRVSTFAFDRQLDRIWERIATADLTEPVQALLRERQDQRSA